MSVLKCKDKIEALLVTIYQKNDTLDSFYFACLVRNLEDCIKNSEENAELEYLSDVVLYSITHQKNYIESVHLFTLQLVTFAFEYRLPVINTAEIKEYVTKCLQLLKPQNKAVQLQLSTINLMTSMLRHQSGVDWIIEHKVWEQVLHSDVHQRSKTVANASCHFISDLVWKLDQNEERENQLIDVIDFFNKPLAYNEYFKVSTLDVDGEDELVIVATIMPFIQTLLTVLREKDKQPIVNRTLSLLVNQFSVEFHMYMIADVSTNHDLIIIITEILHHIWCYCLQPTSENCNVGDTTFQFMTLQHNYLNNSIYTKDPQFLINALMIMNLLWFKVNKANMSGIYEWNGKQYNLEVQQISLVLLPLYVFMENTGSLEDIRHKFSELLSEHTIKIGYTCRDLIYSRGKSNLKKLVIYSLKEYTRLVDHITAAQAGIMYEALHYVLEHYVQKYNHNNKKEDKIEFVGIKNSLENVQIINLSLDLIKSLLLKHNINWYENVEIISLQNILANLLKLSDLPIRQIIQTLDVVEICVSKFLLPDLSLLLDSQNNYTLQELGQLMALFIQHDAWEIRDSTLNILLICIQISFVKYAPMRKIILDNYLIKPMLDLAISDEEMYVQANALKCIAAATTLESFWNSIIKENPQLVEQIILILSKNYESLVRKEAANVLVKMYVNQKVTENFNLKMYRLMAKTAVEDLEWEVQIAALNFWHHMIQNELNNQGMIDGNFPTHTFSKEKHKIVLLNDKEIQKLLSNAMNKLSKSGALDVLHKSLSDENHELVIEKAFNVAEQLITILKKYNFNQDSRSNYESKNIAIINDMNILHNNKMADIQDEFRDGILSKDLTELASSSHECETNIDLVNEKLEYSQTNVISVNDFIRQFQKTEALNILKNEQTSYSFNEKFNYLIECLLNCNVK